MKNKNLIHKSYLVALFIKGIDSILEIIGGILFFFANPLLLNDILKTIFQHELLEDPHDLIANLLIKLSSNISEQTKLFGSIYLLSHGIIKMILVIALLKKKLWAYPLAEVVFTFFVIYQIYRFYYTHSIFLIFLTIIDIAIIILTWIEYKKINFHKKVTNPNL